VEGGKFGDLFSKLGLQELDEGGFFIKPNNLTVWFDVI
jgi:hypothetical protein